MMVNVYRLDLNRKMSQGVKMALLPGDPARSPNNCRIHFKRGFKKLASKREFYAFLADTGKAKILVTSTGIGGPSISIAVDELAQIGVTTFIRVRTTGAIQDSINIGDCIITTGSVRLDGASTHYAPLEYPAVAHHEVVNALIEGAKKTMVHYHVGITASSDTFYPGEEREDAFRKYILRRFRGATLEWKMLHVLNYEMESSTVLTLTASMGL
ncbi:MAG: uridine phosphorylase, partial [Deltaproteobacteria bacterium]|nr:uridine phosphorylase [Deltaproteobacteria bacterium]